MTLFIVFWNFSAYLASNFVSSKLNRIFGPLGLLRSRMFTFRSFFCALCLYKMIFFFFPLEGNINIFQLSQNELGIQEKFARKAQEKRVQLSFGFFLPMSYQWKSNWKSPPLAKCKKGSYYQTHSAFIAGAVKSPLHHRIKLFQHSSKSRFIHRRRCHRLSSRRVFADIIKWGFAASSALAYEGIWNK